MHQEPRKEGKIFGTRGVVGGGHAAIGAHLGGFQPPLV